jgi:hypothetical protein
MLDLEAIKTTSIIKWRQMPDTTGCLLDDGDFHIELEDDIVFAIWPASDARGLMHMLLGNIVDGKYRFNPNPAY